MSCILPLIFMNSIPVSHNKNNKTRITPIMFENNLTEIVKVQFGKNIHVFDCQSSLTLWFGIYKVLWMWFPTIFFIV